MRCTLNWVCFIFAVIASVQEEKSKKGKGETMPQQGKLDCSTCNHPRLTNLSDHLIHISVKERKALLRGARFSVLSKQPEQPKPSIPEAISTPTQFGNSLLKTSSLTEQTKLPNPASDQTEDDLIPSPYHSRISYERTWRTNVPVMDYDIFKLNHPFSML